MVRDSPIVKLRAKFGDQTNSKSQIYADEVLAHDCGHAHPHTGS